MEFQPAKTIDEVIERLEDVLNWAIETENAIGIFPALYIVVTEKVRDGIKQGGIFQDDARMEHLDVVFANRYLEALWLHQNEGKPRHAWRVSFVIAERFSTHTILQELLEGMNPHINLDLGMAAAQVAPGDKIDALKHDFDAINKILGSLVDEIKEDIAKLSPRFSLILKFMVAENAILDFSMKVARGKAWKFAKRLAPRSGDAFEAIVEEKDLEAAKLGNLVARPGFWGRLILWWVKRAESSDVPAIIRELRGAANSKVRFPHEIEELAEEKGENDAEIPTA